MNALSASGETALGAIESGGLTNYISRPPGVAVNERPEGLATPVEDVTDD